MAKYYNLITVGTPTNLTATLQSGGNLAANTTYYYRVIALRVFNLASGIDAHIYGVPTAQVSATTDSTNRTISLSWTAVPNAYGYYVQRTTVSGSYPVGSGNTLAVSGYPVALTATSLVDDGLTFTGGNLDFTEPSPLTEVYSDNNDTIEQYEILAYALSQGWTHVRCPFPQGIVTSPNNTTIRLALPLFFNGGLYLHDCKFRWRGPIGCINGIFYSAPTVEFVSTQYDYGDAPVLLIYNNGSVRVTADGRTQSTVRYMYNRFDGTGRLGLHAQYALMRGNGYVDLLYTNGMGNVTIDGGIIYHRATHGAVLHGYNTINNAIADRFRAEHNISNVWISSLHAIRSNIANYNFVYIGNFTWREIGDVFNYYLADPVFKVVPYRATYYNTGNFNYVTITIGYTTEINITDTSGAPISGARISILDSRGLPATFVMTNAYCSTSINDTDTYTTVTVTNAGELSVNDVVRVMGSDEHMLVTNKSGSSVTFMRGHNLTQKRKYIATNSPKFEKLVDIYTDSNGRASVILQSWLLVTKNSGSYITNTIDNLVSSGYMDRYNMAPYTIQIEKPGYTTYTGQIPSLDNPITLDITLLTVGLIPTTTEHYHAVR